MKNAVSFLLTQKPEEALAFYSDTLGLTFHRNDGFALVFGMNGAMLRIAIMPSFTPAQHTVLGWESDEIAADVDALAAKGIQFERYPGMDQDERGICTFPNGDRVAWFKDPDGNVLSLSQHVQS